MKIDVILDTVCPWCFVGKRRLERALAQRPAWDVQIVWRPFQLDPNMFRGGKDRRGYLAERWSGAERAPSRTRALGAAGKEEGIEFRFDLIRRTPNTVDSHRLIRYAARAGRQGEVVEAVFRAYFTEGRDIGSHEVLAAIGGETGLKETPLRAYLESGRDRDVILAEDDMARQMGVNGVPCYVVDGKYAISGAQSPEVFHQVFELARQEAGPRVAAELMDLV